MTPLGPTPGVRNSARPGFEGLRGSLVQAVCLAVLWLRWIWAPNCSVCLQSVSELEMFVAVPAGAALQGCVRENEVACGPELKGDAKAIAVE